MQLGHVFDIPSFLVESIKFQLHHFSTTSFFIYYSLMFYLFLYTHVDEFEFLGINLMDSNKQTKYVFGWDVFVRWKQNNEGYS